MPTQLRLYTINRGCLDQFAEEWRAKVLPLRNQQGYQVLRSWKLPETNQFVWVLHYDGPLNWAEAEAAYYGSAARSAMDPNPARLIARAEEYFIEDFT